MKFLPFFLAPFIPARILALGREWDKDNLNDLFVETTRRVGVQTKKVQIVDGLIAALDHTTKMRDKRAKRLAEALEDVKKEAFDFKLHHDMIVKAEQSLRDLKVQLESQTDKIASTEKKLEDFKGEGKSELKQAAEALELLQKAKSVEFVASSIESAKGELRKDRKNNEKHVEDISRAEELVRDVQGAVTLEAEKISKAEEFVKELKEKGLKQAEDLAKIEPLLKAREGDKAADENDEKVEAAKQSLHEMKAELNADFPKAASADALVRGVLAEAEWHFNKVIDFEPLMHFLDSKLSAKDIKEMLFDLKDPIKWEAKNIEKAEKLIKELAN